MRNVTESPKISYSAMVRVMGVIRNPSRGLKHYQQLIRSFEWLSNHNKKFQWNRLTTFSVILLTMIERMIDRQTSSITQTPWRKSLVNRAAQNECSIGDNLHHSENIYSKYAAM